jgi:hypothetical protein
MRRKYPCSSDGSFYREEWSWRFRSARKQPEGNALFDTPLCVCKGQVRLNPSRELIVKISTDMSIGCFQVIALVSIASLPPSWRGFRLWESLRYRFRTIDIRSQIWIVFAQLPQSELNPEKVAPSIFEARSVLSLGKYDKTRITLTIRSKFISAVRNTQILSLFRYYRYSVVLLGESNLIRPITL